MKRTICILLCLVFLACQPTPEVDAVRQKNTNQLIEMAINADAQQAASDAQPLAATLPERFTCDFVTDTGRYRVTADVPIRVLTERASFPMLRVERRTLTDAERLRLHGNLFGTDTLYVYEHRMTREQLAAEIANYMQEPTEEEKRQWMRATDSTEEDWQRAMENRAAELKRLQAAYNALSDDDAAVPLSVWDGSLPWANTATYDMDNYMLIIVGSAEDSGEQWSVAHSLIFDARVSDVAVDFEVGKDTFENTLNAPVFNCPTKPGVERIAPEAYDAIHADATISAAEAAEIAIAAFDGVADFTVDSVYWSNNAATDGDTKGSIGQWAYLVRLTPVFDGATTPYVEGMVINDRAAEDAVFRTWQYDGAIAAVDGDGKLLSVYWVGPLRVTKTISETTTLLPFDEIQTLFAQQMNRKTVEMADGSGHVLTVDSVTLGLFRIREQNSMDTGLLVPAWFFTGTLQLGSGDVWVYDALNPLLVLNAMDGTVIDTYLGY